MPLSFLYQKKGEARCGIGQAEDSTFVTLRRRGASNRSIARMLDISEGTVRYRLKRMGQEDGRRLRRSAFDPFKRMLQDWIESNSELGRRPSLKVMFERLRGQGCQAGYDAFRRFVKKHWPDYVQSPYYIRLETPPGQLAQVDWKESIELQIGSPGNWVKVEILLVLLAFSRRCTVSLAFNRKQANLHRAMSDCLKRLGGVPAVIRPDCMSTCVQKYEAENSVITQRFAEWLRDWGMDVFPARPRKATDKGKVERRILSMMERCDLFNRVYASLDEAIEVINQTIERCEHEWRCGATGTTVAEAFQLERDHLAALPHPLPQEAWVCLAATSGRHDGWPAGSSGPFPPRGGTGCRNAAPSRSSIRHL